MSAITIETNTIAAAPAVIPPPPISMETASTLRLVKAIPVAPELEEITFFDDHPLVPVVVIGAISMAVSVIAVGSIVFWLAIRYSGVLAP